jgi:penicillin amidase
MSWIYTQQPLRILDAVYQLSHAKVKPDFQKGVALIAAPGLNVMYGDAKRCGLVGNRKLYKHNEGVNTTYFFFGAPRARTTLLSF